MKEVKFKIMNESEKKDKILAFLNIEENRDDHFEPNAINDSVFNESSLNDAELNYLVNRILNDRYLTGNIYAFKYDSSLTPFLERGGYVGQDSRKKKNEELQEVIYKKTKWELKLAKWQVIVFWIVSPIALIGSILGIIAFFRK